MSHPLVSLSPPSTCSRFPFDGPTAPDFSHHARHPWLTLRHECPCVCPLSLSLSWAAGQGWLVLRSPGEGRGEGGRRREGRRLGENTGRSPAQHKHLGRTFGQIYSSHFTSAPSLGSSHLHQSPSRCLSVFTQPVVSLPAGQPPHLSTTASSLPPEYYTTHTDHSLMSRSPVSPAELATQLSRRNPLHVYGDFHPVGGTRAQGGSVSHQVPPGRGGAGTLADQRHPQTAIVHVA